MNYIIEDNFDFFKELSKEENIKENDENKYCLLDKQLLDENAVTLKCNHSFNFIPLYHEIIQQKMYNNLEVTRLKQFQIKCPYCRHISDSLLPHIKINDSIKFINGVNSPANVCMVINKCKYKFKCGKNKGKCCEKSAMFYENNYYCNQHIKYASKINNINYCKAILKSGKNKGKQCTCKAIKNGEYCKRHDK